MKISVQTKKLLHRELVLQLHRVRPDPRQAGSVGLAEVVRVRNQVAQ